MQKMTLKHTIASQRFIEEHYDNCTSCGRLFQVNETTHLGRTLSNRLIYVGDCCSNKLNKTIIRHSYSKRPYQIPSNKTKLWRFMDFTKFVALISSKTLFFSRADKFEDPFEGAKGLKKNKRKWDRFYLNFFEQAYRNPPEGVKFNKTEAELKREAKQLLVQLDHVGISAPKTTFINCWHENEFESEAMWKLYTKNMAEGIVIQTTYERLYKGLKKNPSIHIGRVNYIDYSKRFVGINESFWFKRKSFEHEREVRAIYKDYSVELNFGIPIDVNLDVLIQNIYISPIAQPWFHTLVKDTLKKYEIEKRVHFSSMLSSPFY